MHKKIKLKQLIRRNKRALMELRRKKGIDSDKNKYKEQKNGIKHG